MFRVLARWATLALLMFVLLPVVNCATDPVSGDPYLAVLDPADAQEAELGRLALPNFIAMNGGRYPDRRLHAFLREIVVAKMARTSQRPSLEWTFDILNTSVPNAFALPGGKVMVTRGLLVEIESEAQFAHLMGHEVGHVAHRHGTREQGRKALVGIVSGIVDRAERTVFHKGPDAPTFFAGIVAHAGQAAFLPFSRSQELQSDERGVDYALQAGYDARESVKTFERFLEMKQERGQRESYVQELVSTHPLDSRRIRALEAYLGKQPDLADPNRRFVVTTPRWEGFLARLRGEHELYLQIDEAVGVLQRAAAEDLPSDERESRFATAEELLEKPRELLDHHASTHLASALLARLREDWRETFASLNRAVARDPEHFGARILRGGFHRSVEKFDHAIADYQVASSVFPASPFPAYYSAEVHEKLGRDAAALKLYEQARVRAPFGSPVRYKCTEKIAELEAAAD